MTFNPIRPGFFETGGEGTCPKAKRLSINNSKSFEAVSDMRIIATLGVGLWVSQIEIWGVFFS